MNNNEAFYDYPQSQFSFQPQLQPSQLGSQLNSLQTITASLQSASQSLQTAAASLQSLQSPQLMEAQNGSYPPYLPSAYQSGVQAGSIQPPSQVPRVLNLNGNSTGNAGSNAGSNLNPNSIPNATPNSPIPDPEFAPIVPLPSVPLDTQPYSLSKFAPKAAANLKSYYSNSLKNDFGLILIGAVIFVASFLWKDLLTDVKDKYFPQSKGLFLRFVYVLVVTAILLLLAAHIRMVFGLSTSAPKALSEGHDDHLHPDSMFDDEPIGSSSALSGSFAGINPLADYVSSNFGTEAGK